MAKQPLAEVFGFPIDNMSDEANRHRDRRLCRFNNVGANCTKDKAVDPLGVCLILTDTQDVVITCPIRFRERWIIADHAAGFLFPEKSKWTTITEVQLRDQNGKSAGSIDVVLVSYDDQGRVAEFGALEIQAVYISGNIRKPFQEYMASPESFATFNWEGQKNYPRSDYLSSSRKRLAPQLIYKSGILHSWEKRSCVALNSGFFATLPKLEEVSKDDAEIAWMIYDLQHNTTSNCRDLVLERIIYTRFTDSLKAITESRPGNVAEFISVLQEKIDAKLDTPPHTETIDAIL